MTPDTHHPTVPAESLPARVLLCRDPGCNGEFYLPLDLDDHIVCPNDRTHPVAVYSGPMLHTGDVDQGGDQ